MNADDRASRGSDPAAGQAEKSLHDDLRALYAVSSEDLPSIDQTARLLQRERAGNPGGLLMKLLHQARTRPWPATAAIAAALAVILLFVPVSYQRTIGHDVTLTVGAPGFDPDQLQKIASELKSALHATSLSIRAEDGEAPVLSAQVPGGARVQVDQVARAFARGLVERGIPASVEVSPRVERVFGNVYAYARDAMIEIRVSTKGKTPQQIEDDIKSQLEAAGVKNPTVEYSKDGNRTTLKVEVQKTGRAADMTSEGSPKFRISLDGNSPGDRGTKGQRCEVLVHRRPGESDQEVIADVQKQLHAQGIDTDVTVEGGKIQIHPRKP